MSDAIETLNAIEREANIALNSQDKELLAQLDNQLKELQPQIVDIVTSDDPKCDVRELTTKYADVQNMLDKTHETLVSQNYVPRAAANVIPPTVSLQSAETLNANVQDLRSTIQEMHQTVQSAQSATEIGFPEIEENREIRDISAMAVNTVKATFETQNSTLKAENERLKEQIEELLIENQTIKKSNVELRNQIIDLENFNGVNKKSQQELQIERQRSSEDLSFLQAEVQRYESKYNNLNELFKIESGHFEAQKQESIARISQLEAENEVLLNANQRLTSRNQELEQCDMDSASIEIARAAQTIRNLNSQVEELKRKLLQNRAQDIDKTQALKATIAAIHDGDTSYVENVIVEKEDLISQLNQSRNEIEALKSKLHRKLQ